MVRIPLVALAFAFLILLSARADDPGVATGTGRATIKRLPQLLRVQFVVSGEANDVPDAVAKLKEARADASRKLAEIGAAANAIEFGPTRMGMGPPDARGQYMQYVQELQKSMMPGNAPKAAPKPQVVIVSSTLQAEWPLAAATEEELFVAGQALQQKIGATGIGRRDPKKMTPEEVEAAEEAAGTPAAAAATGEPTFQYVCKVSAADRAAARADAFQKAKQEAADTARAAGIELGAMRHASAAVISPTAAEGGVDQVFMQMMLQQVGGAAAPAAEPPTDEASAKVPLPVALQITVTASFSAK